MILLDIKHYIQQHHRVSESNLLNRFELTESALSGLIAPLIKQGHIQKIEAGSHCDTGGCSGCEKSAQVEYQWLDKPTHALPGSIGIQHKS